MNSAVFVSRPIRRVTMYTVLLHRFAIIVSLTVASACAYAVALSAQVGVDHHPKTPARSDHPLAFPFDLSSRRHLAVRKHRGSTRRTKHGLLKAPADRLLRAAACHYRR